MDSADCGSRRQRAAAWYDYVTTDADRLTLSWGIAAANHGAVLANYLEATGLIVEGGRAIGVRATDRLANRRLGHRGPPGHQRHRRRRGPVAGRVRSRVGRPDVKGHESRHQPTCARRGDRRTRTVGAHVVRRAMEGARPVRDVGIAETMLRPTIRRLAPARSHHSSRRSTTRSRRSR